MSVVQTTLSGGEAEDGRQRPETFQWCHECEEWILRSRFGPHWDHDFEAQRTDAETDDDGDDEENEPLEPERVGSWYDITLSYNVEYRFRVPAWNEHQAEDLAKDWKFDARPADSYHVHTDRREVKEIMSDDPKLPDDWDPYGDERLWEAIERGREENEDGGEA